MTIVALLVLCTGALLAVRRRGALVPRGWRRPAAAALVLAGLTMVTVGCSRSDPASDPAAAIGAPAQLDHAAADWGDGLDHVVVYADEHRGQSA